MIYQTLPTIGFEPWELFTLRLPAKNFKNNMSVLVTDKPSKKLSQNLIFRTIERVFEHKNSLICLRDDDFS